MIAAIEAKPLSPLSHGGILIVGTKASNFSDELRNHPRITMWDSQNENWTNKDVPDNIRAIFLTRFIGHSTFGKIVEQARKRQITIFNPEGTGMIAKQVRELLNLQGKMPDAVPAPKVVEEVVTEQTKGKLKPLIPLINFSLSNIDNARALIIKAREMKIPTTEGSLSQFVMQQRKRQSGVTGVPKSLQSKLDVSVEMLDNMINDLSGMRDYLISVTEENRILRTKLDGFKKLLGE